MALAYLSTSIGPYALTPKMKREPLKPKNMLVRMGKAEVKEHKKELIDAKTECTETKTGARFCVFSFNGKEIEGMEMPRPTWEFARIAKTGEPPTIEEAREKKKNDFLVVKCKPKEICRGGD